jgi:hypothetical protein
MQIVELLTESKCLDLMKNIIMIIKRLKEIQRFLISPNPTLLDGLSKLISDLDFNFEDKLENLKAVNIQHKVEALKTLTAGVLCVNVFNSLQKIGNKTSLAIVMRGLLDPNEFHEVQENAKILAEEALEKFQSDIEFLIILIRRGNVAKSSLKKSIHLKVLKDHFEEFVSAKERLEVLEE